MNINLSSQEVYQLIREGLAKKGLAVPERDDCFSIGTKDDELVVEVAGVTVSARKTETISLADAERAAQREPAGPTSPSPSPRKPLDQKIALDEDPGEIQREIRRANAALPPSPIKGNKAGPVRQVRVAATLEELGKDPTDISDEIS